MCCKKKKIAILTTGSINDRKGLFNAAHNRISYLKSKVDYDIDVFLISYYPTWFMRVLRRTQKNILSSEECVDGIKYNIIWISMPFIDWFCEVVLHRTQYWRRYQLKKLASRFSEYDLLDVHSVDCGYIAYLAKEKYNIPYCVTWHGSDIHTYPFNSKINFNKTKLILDSADCNFFVSKALLETSNKISRLSEKKILYNGCDKRFFKYSDKKKDLLREEYNVKCKHIVTFSGNQLPIKNTMILPDVYEIVLKYVHDVEFWFIGDGKVRFQLERICDKMDLPTRFWGNQPSEKMPDFMNMTDVLVLPSKNEGLPLVAAEAINCGAHAVGSNAGGIPEVMGVDNTFDLNSPSFIEDFANRIIFYLTDGIGSTQKLPSYFSWDNTAVEESVVIKRILSKNQ